MPAPTFKILYVCNRNNARSPLAAACTLERLRRDGDGIVWQISSAGTHAVDGDIVRSEAHVAAEALSLDLSDHRAASLTAEGCSDPDIILAMSWDQVSHIWSVVPSAWDKVFTVKEFIHWSKRAPVRPPILFADRVDQMRDKVAQAHAVRKRARADYGFWGGIRPQDLNLIEPNGKGDEAWQTLGHAVQAVVSDIITLLLAKGDGTPAPVVATVARKTRRSKVTRSRR